MRPPPSCCTVGCAKESHSLHTNGTVHSKSLLGTGENFGIHCLSNNGWGSGDGSMSKTSISKTSISSSNRGSSISSMSNWGSVNGSNWDMGNTMNWGGHSLGNSLDGVGAGFVNNWLVDSLVGTDWSTDVPGSEGRNVLEDGLGNMMGLDNWGGLVGGNWGWDVGMGGLSHGVGQGGDLGDDLSVSMSLSGRVGKVASQPVVLDGSRVMCWGTDKVGGSISNNGSTRCYANNTSTAKSDKSGEEQEGIHGGVC